MKKFIVLALVLAMMACAGVPAFAGSDSASSAGSGTGTSGEEQTKNLRVGSKNAVSGWQEYMDYTSQEAAKGKNPAEHVTGVVAGSAIGIRKGIHRMGAGAIDLLTFWIPKKQPLVTPEEPRLK